MSTPTPLIFNSIMKICISTLNKPKAADSCHLFYSGANSKGNTVINPFDPDKAMWVNAKIERTAHAD